MSTISSDIPRRNWQSRLPKLRVGQTITREYLYQYGPGRGHLFLVALNLLTAGRIYIMLLQSLVAVLASGLVLETLASPVSHTGSVRAKREVPASHNLHERHLSHWPQSWAKRSKVPDAQILPMRIGLKQCNLEEGHDKLMDISTPGSANYGKHMTPEEVIDFFAPHSSSTDLVMEWVVESGISADRIAISANKQVLPLPLFASTNANNSAF
jgi:hypothetical protein